jgi:hypothetical protein
LQSTGYQPVAVENLGLEPVRAAYEALDVHAELMEDIQGEAVGSGGTLRSGC